VFDKGTEKIGKDIENRQREIEMDSPEYMERLSQMFADIQAPMREQREVAKSLEGKSPDEVRISGFGGGSDEQGKQVFKGIAESVADSHRGFHFVKQKGQSISPQQRIGSEIVKDVKKYPRNWRIDEVITEYDNYGRVVKKELALIHYSAQIGLGGEVFGDQPVYPLVQKFNQSELAEINQALGISQTSISNCYQKDESTSIATPTTPNSNSNLGTISLITIILTLASLVTYGIIKKSKKVKKSR